MRRDMNSGYVGWSMSRRAQEAYDEGEAPKSKWTKARIRDAIDETLREADLTLDERAAAYLDTLTKDELFHRFLRESSWHHTSKYCNRTTFYAVDEDEIERFANKPTRWNWRVRGDKLTETQKGRTFTTRAQAKRFLEGEGFEERPTWFFRLKDCALAEIVVSETPLEAHRRSDSSKSSPSRKDRPGSFA